MHIKNYIILFVGAKAMKTEWDENKKGEWGANAAFWIRIIRGNLDPFRTHVTHDAVLKTLPTGKGLRVLDAACGEGYLTRMAAQRCLGMSGIDFSPAFIAAAKEEEAREPLGISYEVGDMRDTPFSSSSFDVVFSHQGIQEIENPEAALREFARILKTGGKLVLLFLHPSYNLRTGDTTTSTEYFHRQRIHRPYYLVGDIQSPAPYSYLHLPLEEWTHAITEAGFTLLNITEPHPSPELLSEQWWKEHFARPRFILIEAEKAGKTAALTAP